MLVSYASQLHTAALAAFPFTNHAPFRLADRHTANHRPRPQVVCAHDRDDKRHQCDKYIVYSVLRIDKREKDTGL